MITRSNSSLTDFSLKSLISLSTSLLKDSIFAGRFIVIPMRSPLLNFDTSSSRLSKTFSDLFRLVWSFFSTKREGVKVYQKVGVKIKQRIASDFYVARPYSKVQRV